MRTTERSALVHRCQCVSTKPGMQIMPPASMTDAPGASSFGPTAMITPSFTCTSPRAKSPIAASTVRTIAPRITNSPRAGSERVPDCASGRHEVSPVAANAAAALSTVRRSLPCALMMKLPGSSLQRFEADVALELAPSFEILADDLGKILRRLGADLEAVGFELLTHVRLDYGAVHFLVEQRHDLARSSGRRDEPEPAAVLVAGQRFGDRRIVGVLGRTLGAPNGEELQPAGGDVRLHRDEGRDRRIDASAHDVGVDARGAVVGDVQVGEPALGAQELGREMDE